MKIQALLPMKDHSERLPSKNIRPFAGQPLFFHVLKTLLQSPYVNTVTVNTDSRSIAALAGRFSRVRIICRPEALCGDLVSMNDIIAHDLDCVPGEHFLQTHSTNPLLAVETLNRAIEEYFSALAGYDSLFSVTRLQTRLYSDSGPLNHDPTKLERTQDLPPVFEENSNIYLFSRDSFNTTGRRIGARPKMFPMSRLEAMDIDEQDDFILAEALYKMKVAPSSRNQPHISPDTLFAGKVSQTFPGIRFNESPHYGVAP
ncbi:MAG: acylneuraminate cytidylyltransferase family protein [Desulfovibrio sp.]|jgi:CMP-N-acetylneuraminic acid synthetase|nr:acylneuraminate cytidylyltransferase family protein [Desulfovibrio sp.]